jgi:hypothetical protein
MHHACDQRRRRQLESPTLCISSVALLRPLDRMHLEHFCWYAALCLWLCARRTEEADLGHSTAQDARACIRVRVPILHLVGEIETATAELTIVLLVRCRLNCCLMLGVEASLPDALHLTRANNAVSGRLLYKYHNNDVTLLPCITTCRASIAS